MLLSTLWPTAIHLGMAIGGLCFVEWAPGLRRWALAGLERGCDGAGGLTLNDKTYLAGYLAGRWIVGFVLAVLVLAMLVDLVNWILETQSQGILLWLLRCRDSPEEFGS